MPKLLEDASEDGPGQVIDWNGNVSPGTLNVYGVWGGAIVVLESSIKDDNNKNPVWDSLGANSIFVFDVKTTFQMSPGKLRAIVSKTGPTTKLNMDISPG